MNKLQFFAAFLFSLTIISCNFSKGVKKEMNTGLYTSYNGFGVDEIYLADDSGNRLSDNKIKLGTKLALVATGVDSYKDKDGKVFPGCSIVLTDKTGTVIFNLPGTGIRKISAQSSR